jgi:GNAT superfamily N-acetyltransferase
MDKRRDAFETEVRPDRLPVRSETKLTCRRMTKESRADAFHLLEEFLARDEYYLKSSNAYGDGGSLALNQALDLFLSQPDLGFVWLAYDDAGPVAVCVVSFAISTSAGAIVAKLDDVSVIQGRTGEGIGTAHLMALKEELRRLGVRRIDTSVHESNVRARRFYVSHGFQPLGEARLSLLL